jgi:hypothetical protein
MRRAEQGTNVSPAARASDRVSRPLCRPMAVAALAAACVIVHAAAPPPVALATARHHAAPCGSISFALQSDNIAFDIRTAGIPCALARAVASASRSSRLRPGRGRRYRAEDFACRGRFVLPPGKRYEHYVCVRGRATVTFNRG